MDRLLIAMLMGTLFCATVRAEFSVWTSTTTQHFLRSAPVETSQNLRLYAAKNEWVSFQILVHSDMPVAGITVTPAVMHGMHDSTLPTNYIQLYREQQVDITTPTYRDTDFQPDWYPDALIPFTNPLTGKPLTGARIQAVPFDLPANETHGFWVDLYAPLTALAGDYTGTFTVTAPGQQPVHIQVTLTVWNFVLPLTHTMLTRFSNVPEALENYYATWAQQGLVQIPSDWSPVEEQINTLLAQHGINAFPNMPNFDPVQQQDDTLAIPDASIAAFRTFVDRYHINACEVSHPDYYLSDPVQQSSIMQNWGNAWTKGIAAVNRPGVLYFVQVMDEPNSAADYDYVRLWGDAIRATQSPVKTLVTVQTLTQNPDWGTLYGAVDVWCPLFSRYDQATWDQRRAAGDTSWAYTALCQGDPTPWWQIDTPLLNYRVPAWIAWYDHLNGLLYWNMTYWDGLDDPWTDVPTYSDGTNEYHGEGCLLYPAYAVGYDGVVPSIRLKALRDGIENYDYLAILEQQGKRAEAEQVVAQLDNSWFSWETDPGAYDTARQQLAAMILH